MIEQEKKPFGGKDDPLYEEAVLLVRKHRRASVSLIQRHLQIGYNRASYMLEAMVGTVISDLSSNPKILPLTANAELRGRPLADGPA